MHSGWSLYVKDGKPKFAYNFLGAVTTIASTENLPTGRVTIDYDFAHEGGKPGSGGTGTIFINKRKVAQGRIERSIPFLFGAETADVGVDLYTPVTPDYEQGMTKFTGKINKVTIDLKRMDTAEKQAEKNVEEEEAKCCVDIA
jgi:arylsulfatase